MPVLAEDKTVQRRTGYGLEIYDNAELPMYVDGNVYYNGSKPFGRETNKIYLPGFDPKISLSKEEGSIFLNITLEKSIKSLKNKLITTQFLGKAMVPEQAYENPDGSPLMIDT